VLSETNFVLSERGTISPQGRFLPLLGTVRLAARIAAKINPAYLVDFNGNQWAVFRKAVATRNRLTHPKCLSDLEVSIAEIDDVIASYYWILDVSISAMETSNQAVRRYVDEFSQVVRAMKSGDPAVWAEYRRAMDTPD
jgi:hypothetical protein